MKDSPLKHLAVRTREASFGYSLLELAQAEHQKLPNELEEADRFALQKLVEKKLKLEDAILASSEAADTKLSPEKLEVEIRKLLDRFSSDEEYRNALRAQSFTPEDHKLAMERAIAVQLVLEQVQESAPKATEAELHSLYRNQPEAFARPERRKARHILQVCVDSSESQACQEKLIDIREKLERCMTDETGHSRSALFAKTAELHSQCPSALKGGLLGTFPRGVLYPELDSILFNMQSEQIDGPIKTEAGWHLLFLEEIELPDKIPFEDAKEKLEERVNSRLAKHHQQAWLAARRSTIKTDQE